MIVLHEYPLAIVDHFYFRKFLSVIQPLFKCPSRNTIKRDIFNIYKSEKIDLKRLIEANDSRVAITSDMWTAGNQKKGYMAVTAHFIDATWKMRHFIIRYEICEPFLSFYYNLFSHQYCCCFWGGYNVKFITSPHPYWLVAFST
ncbi:Putative AC9 transposase [Linum perenne]